VKVLLDSFGIEQGFMTTIHAYTNDQRISTCPTRTCAGPGPPPSRSSHLHRSRSGHRQRHPGDERQVGRLCHAGAGAGRLRGGLRGDPGEGGLGREINQAVKTAAEGPMVGVLEYTEAPLVSADIVGNPHSSVFDSKLTMAMGRQAKVVAWYDNEWGFANRMVDMSERLI